MKKYFIAALALVAAVACSKDDVSDPVLETSLKSVTLNIGNMATGSRVGGVTNKAASELACTSIDDKFYIIFADNGGNIVDVYGGTLTDKTLTNFGSAGVYTFHAIPERVNQVAAVGNLDVVPAVNENLSKYVGLWKNEANAINKEFNGIVAYGVSNLTHTPGDTCNANGHTYNLYKATVDVAPYMARIEIPQISCTNFGAENTGYDAIGITSLSLTGGVVTEGSTLSTNAPYTIELGTFATDADVTAPSAQYVLTSANSAITAGTGKVWSWNIAPQSTTGNTLVTNLFVSGWNYTTNVPVRTVTINKYATGSPTNYITEFASGNIYRFNIDFAHNNIDVVDNYICAEVTVTIADWVVNDVTVSFDNN